MSEEIQRFTLRLQSKIPEQRMVAELIYSIPKGQRTNAVCRMLLQYKENEDLSERIYLAVKRALCEYGGPPSQQNTQAEQAGEIRDDILGFLSALQKEGG